MPGPPGLEELSLWRLANCARSAQGSGLIRADSEAVLLPTRLLWAVCFTIISEPRCSHDGRVVDVRRAAGRADVLVHFSRQRRRDRHELDDGHSRAREFSATVSGYQ